MKFLINSFKFLLNIFFTYKFCYSNIYIIYLFLKKLNKIWNPLNLIKLFLYIKSEFENLMLSHQWK